ncbi:MAG: prephenate dehydratase domain-containing protein [Nanoarchaeota archaeon]|nr:hypothetical protein [Nanoarchaeota archaeon]MBU4300280.1 hypothetical protein [Nanoarchaeota archaeon]MBU4452507.1 hypothetical protein [Nanoarchaeota archaeon]MCG2723212.1 hypothetical protein [archaeon]
MKNKTTGNEDIYIGHLDPKYSWSHRAAELLSEKLDFEAMLKGRPKVDDVVSNAGYADTLGVVPIYNSMNGDIEKHMRLLLSHLGDGVYVGDVIDVPIEQCLGLKGDVSEILRIYSHPEAIKQVRPYIEELKKECGHDITVIDCASTALAAEIVKDTPGTDIAAICSPAAAKANGLEYKKLTDGELNKTSFGVLGKSTYWAEYYEKHPHKKSDERVTAVLVQPAIKNYSGLLEDIIHPLREECDMSVLTSLSNEGTPIFYIEIDGGHAPKIYQALSKIAVDIPARVKPIGSYLKIARPKNMDDAVEPGINIPSKLW